MKASATEPRKEKVVGTWNIFKKEKSRRIWKTTTTITTKKQVNEGAFIIDI